MSSIIFDKKCEKLLILKDKEKLYKKDKLQEEHLFRCSETSTIYDLKIFLSKQTSANDFELKFGYKEFKGDDNEKIYNLIDPKKNKIEIQFKIKNNDNQNQGKTNNSLINYKKQFEFQSPINSEVNNYEQNIEREKLNKSYQFYDQQKPESKILIQQNNSSKIQSVNPIIQDNYNYLKQQQQNQNFDQYYDPQPSQTKIEIQIKEYCDQILQEYNMRLYNVEQMINFQVEKKNERIQQQIVQLEQIMNINQAYYQFTKEMKNNNFIERLNILEQEHFKTKQDLKLIQIEIENLNQIIQVQNKTQNQNIDSFQTSPSRQSFQELLNSQQIITLKCRDEIKIQQLQDIVNNAILQGNKAACLTCLRPISASDCMHLGQNGDIYLQIQNENKLSELKDNLKKNKKYDILQCENNCNFFCINDKNQMLWESCYFCPLCLIYSVKSLFNIEYRKSKYNSRIYNS